MNGYHAIFFTDMCTKVFHVRPLGAYRLASELRDAGYRVLVVDFFSKWLKNPARFHKLLTKVMGTDTLMIGFSSTFYSNDNEFKDSCDSYQEYYGGSLAPWPAETSTIRITLSHMKKLAPNAKLIYGGAGADIPTVELSEVGIDFVMQGLSDSALIDFVNKLQKKQFIPFNVKNGAKVLDQDVRARNFDFCNSRTRYHPSDCLENNEVLSIETSRGCLFKCSFCAYPLLGRKKNDPDYHKHSSILSQELKENYDLYGTQRYMFVDDTFNESTDKLEIIYQAIKDSGVEIEFTCYLRLDLLERFPEQIPLLKNMGIRSAFLGIETLNLQAARSIGKKSDPENVKKTLDKLADCWGDGVRIFASFIAGLPHETQHSIDEWMQWVYDHDDVIHGFYLGPLVIDQSRSFASEISTSPEKFGYLIAQDQTWVNNQGLTQDQAHAISHQWMKKAWDRGRLKLAAWDLLGLLNFGYSYTDLKQTSINDLDYRDLSEKYRAKFDRYSLNLLEYVTKEKENANQSIGH